MTPNNGEKRRRRPIPRGGLQRLVGELVRAARINKGISQAQLGAPYLTRAMVSAVELGKIAPSLHSIAHFASKLELRVRDLIPDE